MKTESNKQTVTKLTTEAAHIPVTPSGRVIGIAHRVKKTKEGESRPTKVSIMEPDGSFKHFELETEQHELDFLNGACPVRWKSVDAMEDIAGTPEHQIKWRSAKDEDVLVERHESQCRYEVKRGKKGAPDTKTLVEVAKEIPCEFIGVERGDIIAMTLGGSGDYFAFALSRKMSEIGGLVLRLSPHKLKDHRGEDGNKDDDASLLAKIASEHADDFYLTEVRDRRIIRVCNLYRELIAVMKARIGCEQRLHQRHIGEIFCSEEGKFPEGSITKSFQERRHNDSTLKALLGEEARVEKELDKAVQATDVWQQIFEEIPGIGPRIAARIITATIDIRRFKKASQFVKHMGVHVQLKDKEGNDLPCEKQFPRHRTGMNCNWHPDGRQALYLFADQLNRQGSKTTWGDYLINRKIVFREKHPAVEVVGGKKRYTNGHIHKMAIWRTLTRFATRLYKDWTKLETNVAKAGSQE